jgi:hypothetical protein
MGDHTLLQPVTVHEFRMLGTTIMSALKTPEATACSQLVAVNTPGLPQAGLPNQIISTPTTTTEQPKQSPIPAPSPGAINCPATRTEQTAVSLANTIPLAGVCIPDLPRSRGGWHIALRQWYDVDPKTGYALKDWPDSWFKESMRSKTTAKRSQRALIAHEYEW